MSFRTALLATVAAARALSGPSGYDIRTNQVTVRTRTWDGEYIGDGDYTDEDLVLPAHYPVRYLTSGEVSSSGGNYRLDDILVNHITPSDGDTVGYTPEQLRPTVTDNNVEILYVVTGPLAGEYTLVEFRPHRPFTYQLVLRRTRATP